MSPARYVKSGGTFVELAGGAASTALSVPTVVSVPRTSSTNPATPAYTSVATSATANTKGSWVEIINSTSAAADWVRLLIYGTGTANANNAALFDLGVGASDPPTVVAANFAVGAAPAVASIPAVIDVPVHVPAGSRLWVRWQAGRASAAPCSVTAALLAAPADGVQSPTSLDTIGANTAASTGVALGSSGNTFVEVSASTAAAYRGFVLTATSTDTSMGGSQAVAFDLATGASFGTVMLGGMLYEATSTELLYPASTSHISPFALTYIPAPTAAGTRVGVRFLDQAAASNAGYGVVLLGVPY